MVEVTNDKIQFEDQYIHTTFYIPTLPNNQIIMICPGLKGFKSWGSFPYIAQSLADAGFSVLSFDYSLSGVVDHQAEITRLDLAEQNSISRQIQELLFLTNCLKSNKLLFKIDCSTELIIFGHSLGGGTAILGLPKMSWVNNKLKLITWASIATLNRWTQEAMDEWEQNGRLNLPNARTGQDYYLGQSFLKDVKKHDTECHIINTLSRLDLPHLIIHGDQDPTVPLSQAHELLACSSHTKTELFIVKGADHNFGAVHPYRGTTPALELALAKTILWAT
ncbi:MAG: alpha/beta hydrolase [Sumerlaeia bacterium]